MKTRDLLKNEIGFGVIEALTSILIIGIIVIAAGSISKFSLWDLGLENRSVSYSRELRNALDLLADELKMASSVSPFLPGIDPTKSSCSPPTVTANTIKFMVVYEDNTSSYGFARYYVGYKFDPTTNTLFRGEVKVTPVIGCTIPSTDPLDPSVALPIAKNVVTNGTAFSQNGSKITVSLGFRASNADINRTQYLTTVINTRV